MFHRKDRTLSIRISAREYEALLQVTEASGSPSVSDYMRARISEALAPVPGPEPSIGRLAADLADLKSRLERLCMFIGLEEKP